MTEKEYNQLDAILLDYAGCSGCDSLMRLLTFKYKTNDASTVKFKRKNANKLIIEIGRYMITYNLFIDDVDSNILLKMGSEIAYLWDANKEMGD